MKTDYLERRVARVCAKVTKDKGEEGPPRADVEAFATELILERLEGVNWDAAIQGWSTDFGVQSRDGVERYFVDTAWSPDEPCYSLHSGSDWPGLHVKEGPEVYVRLVGRRNKYLQEAIAQLQSLSATAGAQSLVGIERLIRDGNASNTRPRRVRVRRQGPGLDREVSGIEVQQERTFIARDSSGAPLGAWKIGQRLFLPSGRTVAVGREAVPILRVDLLEHAQVMEHGGALSAAFVAVCRKLVLDSLSDVGPALVDTSLGAAEEEPDDVPIAVQVILQPGMEALADEIHVAVTSMFDEDGYSEYLVDACISMQWIEVACGAVSPGELAAKEIAQRAQRKSSRVAAKDGLEPGEQLVFVELDLQEAVLGRGGLLFPAQVVSRREELEQEFAGSVEEILSDHGLDANALEDLDDDAMEEALKKAAGVVGKSYNLLYRELNTARWVAWVGEVRPVHHLKLLMLVDSATGAQAVRLVEHGSPDQVLEFLNDSTQVPAPGAPCAAPPDIDAALVDASDPGGLTLLRRPDRLLVSRALAERRPEIRRWCGQGNPVDMVHERASSGVFGAISRLWRVDISQALWGRDGGGAGILLSDLARRLEQVCWVLNEVPKEGTAMLDLAVYRGFRSGQRGADIERYRRYGRTLLDAL